MNKKLGQTYKKLFHCGKIVAFWTVFKSDNIDMWMIKITIKVNRIDTNDRDVLLISKADKIQNLCLSLTSGFFPLIYWFVNFTLTDKHGIKIL